MDKSIKQIEKELHDLEKQKIVIEEKLVEVIHSAMIKIAETHPLKRISNHCFIINLLDMVGNTWNPEFYDWRKSIVIISKFLKPKPVREWGCALKAKLESTPKSQPVVFEYRKQSCGMMYSEKIPVSRIFIEQIIKELNQ